MVYMYVLRHARLHGGRGSRVIRSRGSAKHWRRLVITRAENLCEDCLIDIEDTFFGGEVDHIVGVKHGGTTEADNLAYTCQPCNLGSMYWPSSQLVRFFHPRLDHWSDHLALHGALIQPLTAIGEVTVRTWVLTTRKDFRNDTGCSNKDGIPRLRHSCGHSGFTYPRDDLLDKKAICGEFIIAMIRYYHFLTRHQVKMVQGKPTPTRIALS